MHLTAAHPPARWSRLALALLAVFAAARVLAQTNAPTEWIDPDTGHRVIRLSREPGSSSLYFNLNAYTPDGKKMVFSTPKGIDAVDLDTHAIERMVDGRVHLLMVGRKTGRIYYVKDQDVFAADPVSKKSAPIAKVPEHGSVVTVNADETLLAGTITEPATNAAPVEPRPKSKAKNIEDRFNEHLPMALFFLNLATGEVKICNRGNDWLNHLQFSPTDPNLLLFCHEGPWHNVDRIWTIRADGTGLQLIHQRAMAMEIAGHEFWSADGRMIWYDLQTPRGEDFWLGGYDVTTGARTRYHLQRDEWSVHYNVSPDGKLFSGDGGAEGMVAHAKNGKWLYLFRPELAPNRKAAPGTNLITAGVFHAEKLVNMAGHNYSLEPNASFTPDGKWLVFRSNLHGAEQIYAVELKKAETK
jgi:oligogalacturonide lyase